MTVETASFISQLDPTYPASGDLKSEGDNHLRVIKTAVKGSFPNLGAVAVTLTAAQLNTVGVTQAATDNSTNVASTAMVQAAILASSGITANLPAQTGNSGKFLTTNGTSPSWAVAGVGSGGQVITGNITLTASSQSAISVTPATPGLYVTLPDATTLSEATNNYSVYNNGDFDYGVKDSAGTQLGWIRAKTGAIIGLADNTTAAGVWAYYGLEKLGVTAQYSSPTLTGIQPTLRRVSIDSDRVCYLFGGGNVYAIVYNTTTQTFGTATLAFNTNGAVDSFDCVLSANNQILAVYQSAGVTLSARTLTISTLTVTANAQVDAALAGTFSSLGSFIAVGTSWVVSYGRATTTSAIRAITVSGTVPTIGAESAPSSGTTTPAVLFASGSIVRTIVNAGSPVICTPYTVSGSTLTVGTVATASSTAASFRAFLNGNGRIVCHYVNTTHFAAIFSLSGTTETVSSVSLGTAPGVGSLLNLSDYAVVSSAKTVFGTSDITVCRFNILTDTGGTASAGTSVSFVTGGNSTAYIAQSLVVGNTARFTYISSGNEATQGAVFLDCSGTSPVISKILNFGILTSASFLWGGMARSTSITGVRHYQNLFCGTTTVRSVYGGNAIQNDFYVTENSYGTTRPLNIPITANFQGSLSLPVGGGCVGGTSNESIFISPIYRNDTNGVVISRVEGAA